MFKPEQIKEVIESFKECESPVRIVIVGSFPKKQFQPFFFKDSVNVIIQSSDIVVVKTRKDKVSKKRKC